MGTQKTTEHDPIIEESLKREANLTDPDEIEDERIFRELHQSGALYEPGVYTVEDLEEDDRELRAQGR